MIDRERRRGWGVDSDDKKSLYFRSLEAGISVEVNF